MNKKVNDIWIGHINTSIEYLTEDLPEFISRFPYILVTSIDSSRDLQKLKTMKEIVHKFSACIFVDGSLLIPHNDFSELMNKQHIFNGFDEIWLFPSPPLKNVPDELWITGPRKIVDDIPAGLDEWMKRSGCILGMGDGIGLNYVTTEAHIAEILEEEYEE